MGKSVFLTKEQEEQIIYNYNVLKQGLKKSGAFIPVSDKIVKKTLIKYSICIRTIQESNINKYNINHEYFQKQSEDMAYWLGILGSDGCVSKKENQIYIELQRQDRELLEKLNNTIKNERPIKDYQDSKGYESSKLYFYSKQIKQDLALYNIIPNKTYDKNYTFPFLLEKKYYPDYIRGLFDGDGSIKITNCSISWQIDSSSLEIVKIIQLFFQEKNIVLNITKLPKKNINIFRIYGYGKEKIQKIYNILYSTNSNLFLKRKKNKIEMLLNLS